jgi:hypothetical protein
MRLVSSSETSQAVCGDEGVMSLVGAGYSSSDDSDDVQEETKVAKVKLPSADELFSKKPVSLSDIMRPTKRMKVDAERAAPARPPVKKGALMTPPQLASKRANVSTEDRKAWSISK